MVRIRQKMETVISRSTPQFLARVGILLLGVALTMSMTGCPSDPDPDAPADAPEYVEISDWHDLHRITENPGGSYVLMNDLDSASAGYVELASEAADRGRGWQPIGEPGNPFTGDFDGRGYEIRGLFIDRRHEDGVGLFGLVDGGGSVRNVGVIDADVTGGRYVGSLVGYSHHGTVTGSYSTGTVSGSRKVGGLVGHNRLEGNVSESWSAASVSGDSYVGGLVGLDSGTVTNSYAVGSVTGLWRVGGLVGQSHKAVRNSYASGSVTGSWRVGGLIGYLVGGTVINSYAAGSVTGESAVGGLVGEEKVGTVTNSFWDWEASGVDVSDGGVGKTTAEMMDISTFTDTATEGLDEPWDVIAVVGSGDRSIGYVWNIVDEQTYPFLSWQDVS